MSGYGKPLAILAIFTFVVGLIYWPGIHGGFLLDDDHNIAPAKLGEASMGGIQYLLSNNVSGVTKRPVSVLSFAINQYYMGGAPASYKKVNVVIHAATAFVVFFFLSHLLALTKSFKPMPNSGIAALQPEVCWAALLGTVLWMVSPMHVSTVLYSVQRMTMLASLFSMLALTLYIRARLHLAYGNKSRYWVYLVATLGSFVLAVFSKESGLLVIIILLGLELTLLRGIGPRLPFKVSKRQSKYASVLLLLFCVMAVAWAVWQALPGYAFRSFTLTDRLLSQQYILLQYLWQMLLPYAHSLKFYYDDFLPVALLDLRFVVSASFWVLLASSLVAYKGRHNQPLRWFVIFYLLAHTIESSFWPLEMIFEHRNYLASVGLFGLIGYGVYELGVAKTKAEGNRKQWLHPLATNKAAVAYLILLIFNGVMLHDRVTLWADDGLFARMMVEYSPNSKRANLELAKIHMKEGNIERGRKILSDQSAAFPDDLGFPLMEMLVLCQTGKLTESDLKNISVKAGTIPVSTLAIVSMRALLDLIAAGKCSQQNADLMLDITYQAMTNTNNASIRYSTLLHAYSLYLHGKYGEAVVLFDRTLRMRSPESASKVFALYHLGVIHIRQGNTLAAKEQLAEIQRIQGGASKSKESLSLTRLLSAQSTAPDTDHEFE